MYTRAPSFTKTLAVARPIPEFPPVMTAIFPSSFGISSSSLSVEPSVSGSEAGIWLQWNDHRRLQVAFADQRERLELFRDFVSRNGFHNCAGASSITAEPDLSNQTGRVEATYHLELCLPEVCRSRGFRLIGMPGEQGHELHFERSLMLSAYACISPEKVYMLVTGVKDRTRKGMLHRSQASEISPPLAQLSLTCDFRHRNLNTPRASSESEGQPGIMCIVLLPINRLIAARRSLAWCFGSYFSGLRGAGKLHASKRGGNRLMLSRASKIVMCHE